GRARPELAARLASRFYRVAVGIESAPDRAQAVADLLSVLRFAPASISETIKEICTGAAEAAFTPYERTLTEKVIDEVTKTLLAFGSFNEAVAIIDRLPESRMRTSFLQRVEMEREIERSKGMLSELNIFDHVLVGTTRQAILYVAVLFSHQLGGELENYQR